MREAGDEINIYTISKIRENMVSMKSITNILTTKRTRSARLLISNRQALVTFARHLIVRI